MNGEELFTPISEKKISRLSREEIEKFVKAQERVINDFAREIALLKNRREDLKQVEFSLDGEYYTTKGSVTEVREESSSLDNKQKSSKKSGKKKKKKVQLPSERYPEAEVVEKEICFRDPQSCDSCGSEMSSSGLFEVSEVLTVTPATFKIDRFKREKLRCSCCHTGLKTAPNMPRITPGGTYSDEMILDVVMSKYCNLIPIERYAAIAGRNGLKELPPQSLIQLTHYFADFIRPVYKLLKDKLMDAKVLHGDETPHKMLERGGLTKNGKAKLWYLWGFSDTRGSTYFEVRNTRSGDVASEFLKDSKCEFLVSDVYSGYNKSVRKTAEARKKEGRALIRNAYCNAHALRKFKDLKDDDFKDILVLYRKIYRLEDIADRRKTVQKKLRVRALMRPLFEKIKYLCLARLTDYSSKSQAVKAMKYFLKNFEALKLFVNHWEVPIDNNTQERAFRAPVVGRKTWYGNHSLKGAKTTAIIFSIIESCKNAEVNPVEFLKHIVADLHQGKAPYTPAMYAQDTSV